MPLFFMGVLEKRERRPAFSLLSLQRCGVIICSCRGEKRVSEAVVFPHRKTAVKKEEYLADARIVWSGTFAVLVREGVRSEP